MKVKLLTARVDCANPLMPAEQSVGDVIDVPDQEGLRLIAARLAERIQPINKPEPERRETAALAPQEKRAR